MTKATTVSNASNPFVDLVNANEGTAARLLANAFVVAKEPGELFAALRFHAQIVAPWCKSLETLLHKDCFRAHFSPADEAFKDFGVLRALASEFLNESK